MPDLIEHEARDVLAGDGPAVETGEVGERTDGAVPGLVVQDSGADEHPVQAAVPDDGFLAVLVGVDVAQQREDQLVEGETAVTAAVTGADPMMAARRARPFSFRIGIPRD